MAETLVEEKIAEEKDIENSPQARLEKLLRENNIKVFTSKDFDFPKDEETQAKIRAEVDEFLQMREQWREEDRKLSLEREKSWQ
jgi:transposase